jgi:hypothetical protein
MNIKLIKLLATLCAGLCFIIVCEWLYGLYAQKQLLESIQAVDKQKKLLAELPSIKLDKQPESSYGDLVARPLFIQGRKAVAEVVPETTPVAKATETFNWALNGIYTQKDTLYALFSRTTAKTPKDNVRKITKDNDIDGWKLIEIHKDKVVVSQGSQQKELPLRKPKPKDPTSNIGRSPNAPPIPNQARQPLIPVPIPEPVPEEIIEPELNPDESSEPYFENSDNEQFQ